MDNKQSLADLDIIKRYKLTSHVSFAVINTVFALRYLQGLGKKENKTLDEIKVEDIVTDLMKEGDKGFKY